MSLTDQQRTETAADNCEVLRARLARYEDADGKPITTIAEQAREIERLNSDYNEACEDAMCVARELERQKMNCLNLLQQLEDLKAQPSGVVHHNLIEALKFYANGDHLLLADPDAWDTCSGEPINFLHDDAGTASVEDGSIAKAALDSLNQPASGGEPFKCDHAGCVSLGEHHPFCEYVKQSTGGDELIRFDFINADGQPDSKMITHDEMRERYKSAYAQVMAASGGDDDEYVPTGLAEAIMHSQDVDAVGLAVKSLASGGDDAERAAFEAFVQREWPGTSMRRRDALPADHERYGEYVNAFVAHAWDSWQARAALSAPSHGEQVRQMVPSWNLAADELPASGKTVLAFYLNSHGMGRRIRAMHVKRFTVEAEEFADPDTQCCEYSEQDDCYYTTEGWYELIDNWPDYSSCAVIEGVVTHWMPLPSTPSAGSQKEQGE